MPLKNVKRIKHYSPDDAHLAYREAEQGIAGAIGALLRLPVEAIPYPTIIELTAYASRFKEQQPPPPMMGDGI